MNTNELTLGSICAGIGGFDIGFERAGWKTAWQIELDDVNRAVLADRFPDALRYKNLNDWRSFHLRKVACISFGFPCQDLSIMGNSKRDKSRYGLAGGRSGLFFAIMDIVQHLKPTWVAIENVPALLTSNEGRDIQAVIGRLRECGYLGFGRVLDAQYFGVPQKRRRLVLVAGLGRHPSIEFVAGPGDGWAGYTLTSPDKYNRCNSRANLKSELFVIEEEGWDQMAERGREVELHGLRSGLDASNTEEAYAAGNAFPPPMAQWIAEILKRS